ncbi:MAG: hypothetical protein Q9183_002484 [Haloplaca sp. 2 TL-2023]
MARALLASTLWLYLLVISDASALIAKKAGSKLPTGWAYQGCYSNPDSIQVLRHQQLVSTTSTIEGCIAKCHEGGYSFGGIHKSNQCFCDNDLDDAQNEAASDNQDAESCGGNGRMTKVKALGFGNTRSSIRVRIQPQPVSVNVRALATKPPGSNTGANAVSVAPITHTAFLIRISVCGDAVDIDTSGSTVAPESECNVACPGDRQYLCGGGNRLSWYRWTGTPLYVWNYPKGPAAGRYEFLIGGVVIPLLTTSGVNGKYTFVEKFGTGPPNSTGAYELDVSRVNNPSLAWRTMTVKTDVFCSASVTLPDKAGRQINIGGWSGESTFGIRLYWPDGSPGVPGVNDWQENKNLLTLQRGRWYPSAMVMTNGSIMVIGGQTGSNGPPQPNLEVLPRPPGAGVVYLDWLERTDPNNLYPFVAVVPSGIFVAYYNEARILDERTFATIKTLPKIPGAVNNPGAGRTHRYASTPICSLHRAPRYPHLRRFQHWCCHRPGQLCLYSARSS